MKKPNFWLYLAGCIGFGVMGVVAVALAIQTGSPSAYFITGACTAILSNMWYEYSSLKLLYWYMQRYLEVQENA